MNRNRITSTEFKDGMRLLTGAVTIVASDGVHGKSGLTATAVCSVSDSPPTLLVCINKENSMNTLIESNGYFSINILSKHHQELANRFAGFIEGLSLAQRFNEGKWVNSQNNIPVLEDALVSFECKWKKSIPEGSHQIVFGEIIQTKLSADKQPLLYFNRSYETLP